MSFVPIPSPLLTDGTISVDARTLSKLLRHAASASRLVGHLDDSDRGSLVGQLADLVDAITHELSEMLGAPRASAGPGSIANGTAAAGDVPRLTCPPGGDR